MSPSYPSISLIDLPPAIIVFITALIGPTPEEVFSSVQSVDFVAEGIVSMTEMIPSVRKKSFRPFRASILSLKESIFAKKDRLDRRMDRF
jgi:hypothetical protein